MVGSLQKFVTISCIRVCSRSAEKRTCMGFGERRSFRVLTRGNLASPGGKYSHESIVSMKASYQMQSLRLMHELCEHLWVGCLFSL